MPSKGERSMRTKNSPAPFVTVKFAQSLDGRIATSTGSSQWLSAPAARRFVHRLRSEHDAILAGIGTVLADDPKLTVRLARGRDPLRIVVDSRLRTPITAQVLAEGAARGTIIVCNESAAINRVKRTENLGAEVLRLPRSIDNQGVDLARLLEELGRRGIGSLLVEGGKGIITSMLRLRAVDRLVVIVAPKIIGRGIEAIGDLGITGLDDAIVFSSFKMRKLGADIIFDGLPKWPEV
jgi:diaminohydroxyphosphoribosylaminopyrimidine deaminase / 5-amino-6-(5-phosphoribosylamino)uracil reductase